MPPSDAEEAISNEVRDVITTFGDDYDAESAAQPSEEQPLLEGDTEPRSWKAPKWFLWIEVGMCS